MTKEYGDTPHCPSCSARNRKTKTENIREDLNQEYDAFVFYGIKKAEFSDHYESFRSSKGRYGELIGMCEIMKDVIKKGQQAKGE